MDIRRIAGQNIKARRDELGFSQEDLADKSGVHRTYISGLERGVRNPTINIIQAIAVALKIEAAELLKRQT